MQGPVDVCGQLWGYDNLFVCAYEQPEQYGKLMSKVSDAFIMSPPALSLLRIGTSP